MRGGDTPALPVVRIGPIPAAGLPRGAPGIDCAAGDSASSRLKSRLIFEPRGEAEADSVIRVGDISMPSNVTVLTDADELVVRIELPRVEAEEEVVEDEATGDQPTGEAPAEGEQG